MLHKIGGGEVEKTSNVKHLCLYKNSLLISKMLDKPLQCQSGIM